MKLCELIKNLTFSQNASKFHKKNLQQWTSIDKLFRIKSPHLMSFHLDSQNKWVILSFSISYTQMWCLNLLMNESHIFLSNPFRFNFHPPANLIWLPLIYETPCLFSRKIATNSFIQFLCEILRVLLRILSN